MTTIPQITKDCRTAMEKSLEASKRELASIRTGKATVKVVHKLAEEARIGIRHARTGARDQLKHLEKASEDEQKRAEKELQKMHDDYIGRIDELLKGKEAEIMEV